MSLNPDSVDQIATLAKLRLDEGEVSAMTADLERILAYVERLSESQDAPAGEEPDMGPSDAAPERDPEGSPDLLRLSPEEMAPEWKEGFFVVPRLPGLDDQSSESA